MASTNKTPHLGLNQWVLDDPFLMEDMNADNQKIDAAIAASPYVKLFDITTTANAQQVDLNFSGIDLTKYAMLDVLASVRPITETDSTFHVKINNEGGFVLEPAYSTPQNREYIAFLQGRNIVSSKLWLKITGFPFEGESSDYFLSTSMQYVGWVGQNYVRYFWAVKPMSAPLSTLNIRGIDSGSLVPAGTKFEVYGVRR